MSELFSKDGKSDGIYRKCDSIEELSTYIKDLAEYKHDYNTSGYAIYKALLSTEQLMAHLLGTTGFQHGYAQMQYMMVTRGSKTGICVVDYDNLLYPQYDVIGRITESIDKVKKSKEFKEHVKSLIAKDDKSKFKAHADVRKHWEDLLK